MDFNASNETPIFVVHFEAIGSSCFVSFVSFIEHYEGNRSPYFVIIDAAWMKTDFKREGTIEFVEYVRAAFPVSQEYE